MSGVSQLFLGKILFYARLTGTGVSDGGSADYGQKLINNAGCVTGTLSSVTAAVSGGEGSLSYSWTNESGEPFSFSASTSSVTDISHASICPSTAYDGRVKLTITDATGNVAVRSIDVHIENLHA
jgi:hypothetical protein